MLAEDNYPLSYRCNPHDYHKGTMRLTPPTTISSHTSRPSHIFLSRVLSVQKLCWRKTFSNITAAEGAHTSRAFYLQ